MRRTNAAKSLPAAIAASRHASPAFFGVSVRVNFSSVAWSKAAALDGEVAGGAAVVASHVLEAAVFDGQVAEDDLPNLGGRLEGVEDGQRRKASPSAPFFCTVSLAKRSKLAVSFFSASWASDNSFWAAATLSVTFFLYSSRRLIDRLLGVVEFHLKSVDL